MGRLPEQVDLLEAGGRRGVVGSAHHTVQHPLQALNKLLRQLVLWGRRAVELLQLGCGGRGSPWGQRFTFTFRAFNRRFSQKRLTISPCVRRKRNNQTSWYVGTVRMFIEPSAKH